MRKRGGSISFQKQSILAAVIMKENQETFGLQVCIRPFNHGLISKGLRVHCDYVV
jgi:hypothetical protein